MMSNVRGPSRGTAASVNGGYPAVAAVVAADMGPRAAALEDGHRGALVVAFGREAVSVGRGAHGHALSLGVDHARPAARGNRRRGRRRAR